MDAVAKDAQGKPLSVLISQTFTSYNGIELQDAPRDIGVYSVRLEIRDTNYRGAAVSSLTITVSRISLHNTVQIYGIKPPVIVDYQPIEAHSVVTYQKLNSAGQPGRRNNHDTAHQRGRIQDNNHFPRRFQQRLQRRIRRRADNQQSAGEFKL